MALGYEGVMAKLPGSALSTGPAVGRLAEDQARAEAAHDECEGVSCGAKAEVRRGQGALAVAREGLGANVSTCQPGISWI